MQALKPLTVGQMARRVLRYVPELQFSFIAGYLRAYAGDCLTEADVHRWVRFFDSFVIEDRSNHANV